MSARSRCWSALLLSAALWLPMAAASADDDWPARIVTIEEMRPLEPIRIGVPRNRARGEVRGPTVLRVHVGVDGAVRRTVLLESCGSPAFDEAALHELRSARFEPYRVDGTPAEVQLELPLHFPLWKSRFPR